MLGTLAMVPVALLVMVSTPLPAAAPPSPRVVMMGTYTVDEGHVAVTYRDPGFNVRIPFLDDTRQVQVTLQTDEVRDVPCGTAGGVTVYFDKIEVVNRLSADRAVETVRNFSTSYGESAAPADKPLIFDRVAHVVSEECSTSSLREIFIEKFSELDDRIAGALRETLERWAPGVEVIAVRASKPRVPQQVKANFELVEVERTKLLIARESQLVMGLQAETEKLVAQINARQEAEVANITMAKRLMESEAQRTISAIADEISTARSRAEADNEHYRAVRLAEANKRRLTPEYLQLVQIQAMANATKVYFGEKLPSMYVDRTSPQPSLGS
ncbi:erlin1 [Symbiodinium sp. KB8]|nr:erlin1 [Symbiodinium sp. KB8]